jgi:hypothetical protein
MRNVWNMSEWIKHTSCPGGPVSPIPLCPAGPISPLGPGEPGGPGGPWIYLTCVDDDDDISSRFDPGSPFSP